MLIAGILFAVGVWRSYSAHGRLRCNGLREPILYAVCFGVLLICWLFYVRWNFGAFFPETLIAKKAQMSLKVFGGFNVQNLKTQMIGFGALYLLTIGVLSFIVIMLGLRYEKLFGSIRRYDDLLLLALVWGGYAIGDTVAYLAFNVSIWPWYVIAILFSCAFAVFPLAIIAIDFVGSMSVTPKRRRMIAYGVLMASCSVLWHANAAAVINKWLFDRNFNSHILSYIPAVDFIRNTNPNGTVIATAEPGAFGFQLGPKFKVVDTLGLASPQVARKIIEGDMDYPFRRWQPDYIILSWKGPYTPEGRPWFNQNYTSVLSFDTPYWKASGITVHVFKKNELRKDVTNPLEQD
jgi:hypothetical protein